MSEHALSPLPRWVRALDAVSLLAIALGLCVLVTGGFRESTPIGRVSFTSAERPLAVGALLMLVRHAVHRGPSLLSRIAGGLSTWRAVPEWRVVWPLFVVSRFGILVVGCLAIALFGHAPNTPPWRLYENDFANLPARWDTGWYLGIAQSGYSWHAEIAGQQNIAFFPAYPLLIRAVSRFFGHQAVWAAVVISFVAFLFALVYLVYLARSKLDGDAAEATLTFLAVYPFAFYYSAAYTEALFLLTVVGASYHFERGELARAAGWGLVCGLTRPNGCLLSVPLALLALRGWPMPLRAFMPRVATAAMPGFGMLIFSVYIFFLTGNPLEWAAAHAAYGRVYRGLDALIAEPLDHIQSFGAYDYLVMQPIGVLNLAATVLAVASIWPVHRRFGAPYSSLIVLNVAVPALIGGALSMGRITSTLFPIFLWLGAAIPTRHRPVWLIAFAMLQGLCAAAFFTWRPIF